jgi:hypothetical protein
MMSPKALAIALNAQKFIEFWSDEFGGDLAAHSYQRVNKRKE